MNRRLPRNRNVTSPRNAGGARGMAGLRAFFLRLGHAIWPERYSDPAAQQRAAGQRPVRARGFIWIWTFAVALSCVAFVAHLRVRFEIIQTGYALSQAQGEQRRLRLDQRELRLELATLKEPGRIEEQARELLGMDRPDHDRIIRLGERGGTQLAAGRRR